jgi:hypothetical protein
LRTLVGAYGEVRSSLLRAQGWPTAADLGARVFAGQTGYGMAATGAGHISPGAEVIRRLATHDARPLWICIRGGANTLAQALIDGRSTLSADELAHTIARLRVYSISDQDDAGPWIRGEFPSLFYIVQPSTF